MYNIKFDHESESHISSSKFYIIVLNKLYVLIILGLYYLFFNKLSNSYKLNASNANCDAK